MVNKLIIEQPWGGLGDNLQFSTLPELCHAYGIDVYVSNRNVYRNEDIKKLVWESNPFIKGFIDEPGNVGNYIDYGPSNNVIMNWEQKFFGEFVNDSPKLYYTPNIIEEFLDKVVIDDNAISRPIDFTKIVEENEDAILLNKSYTNRQTKMTSSIYEWIEIY